jgi:drug/metabolite transporter (DMT)-like permease
VSSTNSAQPDPVLADAASQQATETTSLAPDQESSLTRSGGERGALKTRVCLLIIIVANALGNVLLSLGMRQVGSIASYSPVDLFVSGVGAIANPYVLAGVGFLLVFFAAHMIVLSWADLSYVLPITSVGYIVVAVLSWWWLQEPVRPLRWAGTVVIVVGVSLVGRTPVSTTSNR